MSEEAAGTLPEGGVTAGMLLRRAREAAGLHVATLAVALKVPVRKLEALEDDRYDQLSDAVFVRALASSVCRTLKIDPQPILERLPQGGKPRLLQTDDGINAPFRAPGDGPRPSWMDQVTRPVGLVVVALLLGALVIVLLPTVRPDPAPAPRAESVMPPNAAPSVVIAQVDPTPPPAAPASTPATPPAPAPTAMPVTPTPAGATASTATAAAPPIAAAEAASSAPPSPATGVVVFTASAPSWVQVMDARGNAVLRRTLEPGETAGATGPLPLSVTVGSVQSTRVQVRGQPFDLQPVTRDNVARFEVK